MARSRKERVRPLERGSDGDLTPDPTRTSSSQKEEPPKVKAPEAPTHLDLDDQLQLEIASFLISHPLRWRRRRSETISAIDHWHHRSDWQLTFEFNRALLDDMAQQLDLFRPALGERLRTLLTSHDEITLHVPVIVLSKRLLLQASLADAKHGPIPLQNRIDNAYYTAYHTIALVIAALCASPAERDPDKHKSREVHGMTGESSRDARQQIEDVIDALCYCIPEAILSEGHLDRHSLRWRFRRIRGPGEVPQRWLRSIARYLARYDIVLAEEELARTRGLLFYSFKVRGQFVRAGLTSYKRGLRDPFLNPLLLVPDLVRLAGRRRTAGEGSESPRVLSFFDSCDAYLHALESLLRPPVGALAGTALLALRHCTDYWYAFARLDLETGAPLVVSFTQTIRMGRPYRALLLKNPIGWAIKQRYWCVIGDAQSTHVTVECPDNASVRLVRRATRLEFQGLRRRKLVRWLKVPSLRRWARLGRPAFGMAHVELDDVHSFYTTKTQSELHSWLQLQVSARKRRGARRKRELPHRAPTPQAQGAEATSKQKRGSRKKPVETASLFPEAILRSWQRCLLRVTYKPRRTIARIYAVVTLFSTFIAARLCWQIGRQAVERVRELHEMRSAIRVSNLLKGVNGLDLSEAHTTVAGIVSFAVGLVLVRERARVAALCLTRLKVILATALVVLLSILAAGVLKATLK